MVGWHHQLNGHEFEQALEDGDGRGSLACCSPWGCKESDTTEQLTNNKKLFIRVYPRNSFPPSQPVLTFKSLYGILFSLVTGSEVPFLSFSKSLSSSCKSQVNPQKMVLFSCSAVSNSLQPYGLQHTRPPCPSLSPGACSNSCPLSQ